MSNNSNDELFERAREIAEYFTNTLWERVIDRDIEAEDLEALRFHVHQAEAERAIQEDLPIQEAVRCW